MVGTLFGQLSDISSVYTEDISSVYIEDISSVYTEYMSSVYTDDTADGIYTEERGAGGGVKVCNFKFRLP